MDPAEHSAPIPLTLRIGVAGPHLLSGEEGLRGAVSKIIGRLNEMLRDTEHSFVVVSSLAEGASQLLASEILKQDNARLEVVLPISPEECPSGEPFRTLLDRARKVRVMDAQADRSVQEEIVRDCNLMVVIWSGEKVASDEAWPIVEYAQEDAGRTLALIDARDGKVRWKPGDDAALESIENYNTYNSERISASRVALEGAKWFRDQEALAYECGLASGVLEPLKTTILPQLTRADLLAARYQMLHVWSGAVIYIFAVAAVASVLEGFFSKNSLWNWIEIGEVGCILMILGASQYYQFIRRWIDYRFLAERLRSAAFLYVAGLKCEPSDPPHYLKMSHRSNEWMVTAFSSVGNCEEREVPSAEFDAVRKFSLRGWILDQQSYYVRRAHGLRRWQDFLGWIGYGLFAVTGLATIGQATGFLPMTWNAEMTSLAIVLPAAGASVAGFRAFREYSRTHKQCEAMAKHLTGVAKEIGKTTNVEDLKKILKHADHAMLREQQSWRVVVFVHETKDTI